MRYLGAGDIATGRASLESKIASFHHLEWAAASDEIPDEPWFAGMVTRSRWLPPDPATARAAAETRWKTGR